MSTLAVIATSAVTGVIGAAAMYIPARLARYDAATYRDLAERKLDECEARDAAFEATRNKPWHYAAELPPAADHKGEVLHVEHPTGEIHRPTLDDLAEGVALAQLLDEPNRCPECRLLSAHKPTCSRPEPMPWELPSDAMALLDRPAEDEDEVGDEQPGEASTSALVGFIKRIPRLLFVGLVVPPLFVWSWCVRWPIARLRDGWSRRPDFLKSADQQAAEFWAEPTTDAEERRVEIEAWVDANPPTPSYKPWHLHDVTAMHEVVRPGRHRAAEIPAQRSGDADA